MPTTIDSMTGIKITSPFFDMPLPLELFPVHPHELKGSNAAKKNRVALIYGTNGSGKSTIAQGFREYAESIIPRTVDLIPLAGTTTIKMSPGMKSEKFFVFDETYISQNIKVKESGLETIVLFGKQVELEKRLDELEKQFTEIQSAIDLKSEFIKQFNIPTNVIAPAYWQSLIIKKLQAVGGWAETSGISIKKNQIKARVTDREIDRLGKLCPRRDESVTRVKFNELMDIFNSIDASSLPVTTQIQSIEYPERILEDAKKLLVKVPQKPALTLREQELLQSIGIEVLSNAKGFLSARSYKICPTCLQQISEEHRITSLQQIENILNREVEEYRDDLKKLILPEIQSDGYRGYDKLDTELFGKLILQISLINKLIADYNKVVQGKIADPLSSMQYDSSVDLMVA